MAISQNFPSVRPTLDLNFAATKRLDPRITFSRGSVGTYHDSTGTIQIAAPHVARFDHNPATGESLGLLVEEARTNLRIYSSAPNASNSYRIYGNATYNAAVVAPDGTATATLITGNGSSSGFDNYPNDYGSNGGAVQTYSFYVRNVNATSLQISMGGYGNPTYTFTFATETGVANAAASGSGFQKLSNGWYRIWLTGTKSNQFWYQQAYIDNGSATSASMYFWGIQLESAASFPTSYIPTPATFTGRASTATFYNSSGIIQTAAAGVARSAAFFPDSNGVMRPAGLLLEAAGTNGSTYSEDASSWGNVGGQSTLTATNVVAAPDGTTTADNIYGASGQWTAKEMLVSTLTVPNGSFLVMSVFAKKVPSSKYEVLNLNISLVGSGSPRAACNLTTGVVLPNAGISGYSEKLSNGWYRFVAFLQNTTGSTQTWNNPNMVRIFASTTTSDSQGSASGTGSTTDGVYVWGRQTEVVTAPYATSYIPTVASTVTRAADTSTSATVTRSADVATITGTNFSSWFNRNNGTLLCNAQNLSSIEPNPPVILTAAPYYQGAGGYKLGLGGFWSNVTQLNTDAWANGSNLGGSQVNVAEAQTSAGAIRHAFAYSPTDCKACAKQTLGNTGGTQCFQAAQGLDRLLFRQYFFDVSSCITRITYWPTRLSDATLQQITR